MKKTIEKTRTILLITPIVFGLVGCVSLNSHQTGRTMGEGNSSFSANLNYGHIKSDLEIEDENSDIPERFSIAEAGTVIGLQENLDVGLKLNTSSYFTINGKYQFIGNRESLFASSLGLDISYDLFDLIFGMESYSCTVSSYSSIHPTDYISIALTTRYNLVVLPKDNPYSTRKRHNIYGYSVGLIIGIRHQISIALSQYVDNTIFSFDIQPIIGLGYIINFN